MPRTSRIIFPSCRTYTPLILQVVPDTRFSFGCYKASSMTLICDTQMTRMTQKIWKITRKTVSQLRFCHLSVTANTSLMVSFLQFKFSIIV